MKNNLLTYSIVLALTAPIAAAMVLFILALEMAGSPGAGTALICSLAAPAVQLSAMAFFTCRN